MKTIEDILECRLKDLYGAEDVVIQALSKIIGYTADIHIRKVFTDQFEASERHKNIVKELCSALHIKIDMGIRTSLVGLKERIENVQSQDLTESFKNDEMIAAAEQMELYKINGYISASTNARKLGYDRISKALMEILDETYDTDEKLKRVARRRYAKYSFL